jgi:SAM-dependent methyltransferase
MTSFYSEFAPYYEQIFPFREEVHSFLLKLSGPPGSRILDLGCGPGHYCGRFAREGFEAEGIDLDKKMIEAAEAAYSGASFRCADIAGPDAFHGRYRMIYCIGNVLSHVPPSLLGPFLRSLHAALEEGGCWVFQVVNWDYLLTLKEYVFPEKKIGDGTVCFYRSYPVITSEEALFDVRLEAGGVTVFKDRSVLYPLTSGTFEKMHELHGFHLEGAYAGFDGSAFLEERNSGLVMVFRKV